MSVGSGFTIGPNEVKVIDQAVFSFGNDRTDFMRHFHAKAIAVFENGSGIVDIDAFFFHFFAASIAIANRT